MTDNASSRHPGSPKVVGVRDFRENLTAYLEAGEPLAISKKGKTVGLYTPVYKRPAKAAIRKADAAFKRLNAAARRLGITQHDIDQACR